MDTKQYFNNMDNNQYFRLDRNRINIQENYEVEYWTKELGISREYLKKVVNTAGSSADAVREYLQKISA